MEKGPQDLALRRLLRTWTRAVSWREGQARLKWVEESEGKKLSVCRPVLISFGMRGVETDN